MNRTALDWLPLELSVRVGACVLLLVRVSKYM